MNKKQINNNNNDQVLARLQHKAQVDRRITHYTFSFRRRTVVSIRKQQSNALNA